MLLRTITPDFLDLRLLWFGLTGFIFLAGISMAARAMGQTAGTRAMVFSMLVWIAIPTISTFQKGNVQIAIVASSMIAMALIGRGRRIAGGALLAFAIVSKLWPGMLVVYLMASYRTVALTLLAWLALNVFWPQDWPIDARARFALLLVPFVAIVGVTLSGFVVPLPFRTRARVGAVRSPA